MIMMISILCIIISNISGSQVSDFFGSIEQVISRAGLFTLHSACVQNISTNFNTSSDSSILQEQNTFTVPSYVFVARSNSPYQMVSSVGGALLRRRREVIIKNRQPERWKWAKIWARDTGIANRMQNTTEAVCFLNERRNGSTSSRVATLWDIRY